MSEAKTISILDVEFPCTMPYDAGHTINEAEARVLNQTRRENLGNNYRTKVKEYQEKGTPTLDELLSGFAALDSSYIFTLSNVSAARKLDPVEREARAIARGILKAELDKVGRKITDVPANIPGDTEEAKKEAWGEVIDAEIDRIAALEPVVKQARDVVKARSKSVDIDIGALVGGGEAAPAA